MTAPNPEGDVVLVPRWVFDDFLNNQPGWPDTARRYRDAPAALQPSPETLADIIRQHVHVGEIGSCSIELVGHGEAADAILAALPPVSGGGLGWQPMSEQPYALTLLFKAAPDDDGMERVWLGLAHQDDADAVSWACLPDAIHAHQQTVGDDQ